ncbi:MAG: ATP-grasp domain-containing protein [Planctomycetota bacterium]|jgi:carbamoyl-phosphate synthase large subunit
MMKVCIGITGINAGDNPGPGIAVARSLREAFGSSVEIVGLAYDAMEPGIYMDWLIDRAYILPYPCSGGEAYIARLLDIRQRAGLDVIIPCLDAELPVYLRYADSLAEAGITSFLPTADQFRLRGKDRLGEVAERINVSIPETRVITNNADLERALTELTYPLMVKGIYYEAKKAHTPAEARSYFHRIVAEWGYPALVQELVEGEPLNVVGLGDGLGGLRQRVAVKKVNLSSQGKIATGVSVRHEGVLAAAERFVAATKWRGPFEFECLVQGETIHLIEINPRFPAWTYFATGLGVNLPQTLVELALARQVELPEGAVQRTDYPAGKLFVRYTLDMVADMEPFQSLVTTGECTRLNGDRHHFLKTL